ncbi:hypothetical protein FRX31_008914 [Thalictrum thalictroides]|uniref:Uncharacterized protein n=1 Tax=Thalictrum thalictroides TaxID=46969 RepID=A0A7J6WY66_THATH|nr:hypothetical protein FRX31_008914 [Thalictrum thalictroides]
MLSASSIAVWQQLENPQWQLVMKTYRSGFGLVVIVYRIRFGLGSDSNVRTNNSDNPRDAILRVRAHTSCQ